MDERLELFLYSIRYTLDEMLAIALYESDCRGEGTNPGSWRELCDEDKESYRADAREVRSLRP